MTEKNLLRKIWNIIRYPIGAIPYIVITFIVIYDWYITFGIPHIPDDLIKIMASTYNPFKLLPPILAYEITPHPQLFALSLFGGYALWYGNCKLLKTILSSICTKAELVSL